MFAGEIEVNENYFGETCKGKRRRGAGRKVSVFGLLKRNSQIYPVKGDTLLPIIRKKLSLTVSFAQILSETIMPSVFLNLSTIELIIVNSLQRSITI